MLPPTNFDVNDFTMTQADITAFPPVTQGIFVEYASPKYHSWAL
jgi:hypothetical protein